MPRSKKEIPPKKVSHRKIYFAIGGISILLLLILCLVFWRLFFYNPPIQVKVLVMTMSEEEVNPWLSHEVLTKDIKVIGLKNNVKCSKEGLCVAQLGETKANAAASLMAILLNPQFSFQNSYFLSSGIAGTTPSNGTLGFAAWARWVVDWDQGSHLDPYSVPEIPFGYLPNTYSGNSVFHLNEKLANLAYQQTTSVQLMDTPEAQESRKYYPGQEEKKPYVTLCDTMAGDDFWSGKQLSDKAGYIMNSLTKNQGQYCTTEQEDIAVATVLDRFGYLNKYLSLRTGSDFDQPYPGQTMQDLLDKLPAKDIALANAYAVGSTFSHYLISHPEVENLVIDSPEGKKVSSNE